MKESITFRIQYPLVVKPMIAVDEVVRIKGRKRDCLYITKVYDNGEGEETYNMKYCYKPSPKSRLRKNKKSLFSKIKIKLLR